MFAHTVLVYFVFWYYSCAAVCAISFYSSYNCDVVYSIYCSFVAGEHPDSEAPLLLICINKSTCGWIWWDYFSPEYFYRHRKHNTEPVCRSCSRIFAEHYESSYHTNKPYTSTPAVYTVLVHTWYECCRTVVIVSPACGLLCRTVSRHHLLAADTPRIPR